MLKSLEIRNYALIENLHLDFESGLTIITGQTGAGKSVLLKALGLALGDRADHSALRNPEERCIVEAVFGDQIIRRVIAPGGKSRIFVNDEPAKLEDVQKLSRRLVDIHSQHQHLLLKDEAFTLALIDGFGGHETLLEEYGEAYGSYQLSVTSYQNLLAEIERNRADYDFLQHQLSEFEGIDFEGLDLEALEEEYKLQSGGATVQQGLQDIQALSAQSVGLLQNLESRIKKLESSYPKAKAWHERIQSAALDIEDLSEEVRRSGSGFEYDPTRAAELEVLLGKIYGLQKRYQVFEMEGLQALAQDLQAKIDSVDNFDQAKEALEKQAKEAEVKVKDLGAQLREKRISESKHLESRIGEFLPQLGMGESRVTVEITEKPEPMRSGLDEVRLMYAPHANMAPKPLASIASGGELSRIMLVLKVILARHTQMSTILLDEIDIGISGEIADQVGKLMVEMAQHTQVMAITHLPQVAAKGDHHIKIFKESDALAAYTKMRNLSPEDRLEEIAGMLSGSDVTENAIEQARRLLH